MRPRSDLESTRAFGQMRKSFFTLWLNAHLQNSYKQDEWELGVAEDVFEGETLVKLKSKVSNKALQTPLVGTDRWSNRSGVACLQLASGVESRTSIIVINTRFRFDAEYLAHALIEEIAHTQQRIDGVDFEAQQVRFVYEERPYEQEAKQMATDILGYDATEHEPTCVREEPFFTLNHS